MRKLRTLYSFVFVLVLLSSCSQSFDLNKVVELNVDPPMYPDYREVVVPPNIAPLNFVIEAEGKAYAVWISGKQGKTIQIRSKNASIQIPLKRWKSLLAENIGGEIELNVAINKDGIWQKYQSTKIFVAPDEVDSHLAYRLINVAYILWRKMGLYQRNLTNFKETPIMENRNTEGNCMNCHSFSNRDPERMMFHMRAKYGGTVVSTPDSVFKVDTKTEYTLAAGAYPYWHPNGKQIAFSLNKVKQNFHGAEGGNEVYDRASDIIVYDIESNTVTTDPAIATYMRETLPNWSPDGRYLYFCRTEQMTDTTYYASVKYDLLRIEYNAEEMTFGRLDTILLADDFGKTITFPRVSPDGKYMLFTGASHGYFTIYNKTADLYLLNLETAEISEFPFNSESVESYHQWSSNGRWIVFSSKRIDDTTTRPFFAYFDKDGKIHKPFVLPQENPDFYKSFKTNYNIPEFITGAVDIDKLELLDAVLGEAQPVGFDERVNTDALSGATATVKKENSLH